MVTSINPFPVPVPANLDLKKQGIPVPGSEQPGFSATYISAAFPQIKPDPRFPKTSYDCFELGLKTDPDADCLGERPWNAEKGDWDASYVWNSFATVAEQRTKVGAGLVKLRQQGALGNDAAEKYAVGIWCPNRPAWQIVSQATAAYSLTLVSLYDTLGPNVVEYCINHSDTRIVFAAPSHLPQLLSLAKSCPKMKVLVSIDSWESLKSKATKPGSSSEQAYKAWGAEVGVQVLDIAEVEALGAANATPHRVPKPTDVASICYTSGTTGNPKGAVLLHSALAGATVTNLHGSQMNQGDTYFSYLPLSHIYERFVEDIALAAGCRIGYSCGDNLRLLEDMGILKPTLFASVPRVLNRVYQSIKAATVDAPGLKGKMARKAFADKIYNLNHHGTYRHAFWDRIIFNKVRMALGGQVKWIGTGSAPINPDVLAFLKVALCCDVSEGYGQTENCGTATRCHEGDHHPDGTVGPPSAGMEIRLADVPDMGYFATDKPHPRGEILTRGAPVIPEYLHDPEKTKETIDADGWLHTGDIGLIDSVGRLKIIDRIKNLVKLSQGEYVALEKIENIYSLSPLIAQIYVHGDSLEDHVVAVIVPDPEKFAALSSKALGKHIVASDAAALAAAAKEQRVVEAIGAELAPYAKDARLLKYEAINSDIYIHLDPFTADNDLLTPTFKTKRNVAAKVFKEQLTALYAARPKKAAPKL